MLLIESIKYYVKINYYQISRIHLRKRPRCYIWQEIVNGLNKISQIGAHSAAKLSIIKG